MSTSSPCTDVGTSQSDDYPQQSMSVDGCSPSYSDSLPVRHDSSETDKEGAIRRMKTSMEENRFCYSPPSRIVYSEGICAIEF